MQRVASADEAAVAELYDRFGALVYRTSYETLGGSAEADDAVQDVFVQLWHTAARFDPHRAKLVTWVMLLTRRYLIDRLRRRKARPKTRAIEADFEAVGRPGVDRDASPADPSVFRRLAELPELQRTVIERVYLQGFTLREVSEQLDAPLGTVKSALSRGLGRLRQRLADNQG